MTAPDSRKRLKILVVDDVKSMLNFTKSILNAEGFANVKTLDNGKDALKIIRALQLDLVICDWEMPEVCGMEVLTALREKEEGGDTPFLMVTGMAESTKVVEAVKAGVNGYIVKPLQPNKLMEEVNKCLKNKL